MAEWNSDICFFPRSGRPPVRFAFAGKAAVLAVKWREQEKYTHICNDINTVIIFATICRWTCENSAVENLLPSTLLSLPPPQKPKVLILVPFYIRNYVRDFFWGFFSLGRLSRINRTQRLHVWMMVFHRRAMRTMAVAVAATNGDTKRCNKRLIWISRSSTRPYCIRNETATSHPHSHCRLNSM